MINRQITVGLAMVVSAALGAAAVQALHAQAKPPAYNFAEITIKDQDGYNKEYLPVITKALTDAGGKFIVRGGKPTKALHPRPALSWCNSRTWTNCRLCTTPRPTRTRSQLATSTLRSGYSASKGSRRSVPAHPIRYAAPTRRSQRGLNNDCARRSACGKSAPSRG